ncbi:MAG: UvrD-helicase domain-containing protein [Bacteroidetes bacterium]|uniref:DNA 3'-5' helicase n=1 Tax=Candidatus Gallipaludibacter merdavium TaxID=2840839 RepID=A0A9D9HVN1_9BACT|nr:UvrD-helicase domain-containing protein [Candidatus Gallipaludibacter merdavium]
MEKEINVEFLEDLNNSQREAVMYNAGPSLVIAGAGSGKTRVLTYKIAYLLKMGIPAYRIMALTFTNKAAREMKERIIQLVGEEKAHYLWMGTFHSIFLRILRAEASHIGFTSNFTIYDTDDTKSLLKNIVKQMQLNDKTYKPNVLYAHISRAKNNLISPESYVRDTNQAYVDRKEGIPRMGEIYAEYMRRCQQSNIMDFDDLLYYTNWLFKHEPEILARYQDKFDYILVDEYQDTNMSQDLIVKNLVQPHQRICVVGDDAQSIYSFRGACVDNILKFEKIYPSTHIFKLEQNYRSTQTIVNAANSLIWKNEFQIKKRVFSQKDVGEPLHVIKASTDREEGDKVAYKIIQLTRFDNSSYSDIAILYRTNAQSRTIEESLRKNGIPYVIYGGQSFYQRKEIKDALAYMRLTINPQDEESLRRIINVPARGIGDTTINKLWDAARTHGTSAWNVLQQPLQYGVTINNGTQRKLSQFHEMIRVFQEQQSTLNAYELAQEIVKTSGLGAALLAEKDDESLNRYDNLQELMSGIHEFMERQQEIGIEEADLSHFLGEVSLMTDMDETKEDNTERVTLMTVHAAKGLEFKNVFIVGLEENLFPSLRSESDAELEEERRLLYVAITRAEQRCYLSFSSSRFRNGKTEFASPSRFLDDIDRKYLDADIRGTARRAQYMDFDDIPYSRTNVTGWAEDSPSDSPTPFRKPKQLTCTGREYVKTEEKNLIEIEGLAPGQRIRHKTFGDGTVKQCYIENGNEKVDVSFDQTGNKSLLIKFAKFERL